MYVDTRVRDTARLLYWSLLRQQTTAEVDVPLPFVCEIRADI